MINRTTVSKVPIYALIFFSLAQLGIVYYLESLSYNEASMQEEWNEATLGNLDHSDLVALFEDQTRLIDNQNEMIINFLDFQEMIGWVFLIVLVVHLISLIRRSKAINNNET